MQEASEIAYDIIEESKDECQSIAEEISSDRELIASLNSPQGLKKLVAESLPYESDLSVTIFDYRNADKNNIRFSSSTESEVIPSAIVDRIKQKYEPFSYQEGGEVYGAATILEGDNFIGTVLVHRKLRHELVRNLVDLQNLLRIYAFKQDLEIFIWVGTIVLILVLAVMGAIFAAVLARSVTKPILNLVAGTREVARGNLDHRVQVRGKDEIGILEESFNTMVSQLKANRERLMVAERLAAWRDIARRIAHEIKNPLTPIQLSMYRLRKNMGSERYKEIFEQAYGSITKEVENLRNMVTEFSQFARTPKPRLRPSSPREIVQDAINLYTGLPDNITIQRELADDLPQVMVDKDQIRQVLHNLIGNAVDAMPEGGRITVAARLESDDIVVIEVSDNGCGMSEEVRQKIFTPYFTTKEKGTGLGMAITAQIIEEHGGEIFVDSKEGVGTKVTISLKADIPVTLKSEQTT